MNDDKDKFITLHKKEFDELINCYKKLSNSLKEMNEIKERIENILSHGKMEYQKKTVSKIPGGGKIILMNGEFRKVFGSLLKAIQNKYGNNIYFFSQNEYEQLEKQSKNNLSKDHRNIQWEHKNYHAKKKSEIKNKKIINIIKMSTTKFIRRNKKINIDKIKLNGVSKYIEAYTPINSKIKPLLLILRSEKIYPYSPKKNQYLPNPEDIHKFIFNEKERKKFSIKNSTINWTSLELYFMNLSKYFRYNIPNQIETPGIPYITDELAIQILKSNIDLKSNLFKDFDSFLTYNIKNDMINLFDFFSMFSEMLNLNSLSRDDYFALSKVLKIPIFDFNIQAISIIEDLKIRD